MQIDILNALVSSKPFFKSFDLLQHLVLRNKWLIGSFEEKMGIAGDAHTVSLALDGLSLQDQAFILKSGPIQQQIEQLFFSQQLDFIAISTEDSMKQYAALQQILTQITSCERRESNWESIWAARGFDTSHVLTSPFPYVVSAWSPAESEPGRWNESNDVLTLFRSHTAGLLNDSAALAPFSQLSITKLRNALKFLSAISPFLLHDVSMNVRHCCLIMQTRGESAGLEDFANMVSISDKRVPNCCFFSEKTLDDFLYLVETLYHEALHCKYFNIMRVHKIFRDDYRGYSEQYFECPWRKGEDEINRCWPFDRAFAAFHVYVHLYVLYNALLEARSDLDREWIVRRNSVVREKSSILREWIVKESGSVMTESGLTFLQSLVELFDASGEAAEPTPD